MPRPALIQRWATNRTINDTSPKLHARLDDSRAIYRDKGRPQSLCLVWLGGPTPDVYTPFDPDHPRACTNCALIVREKHHDKIEAS